MKKGILVLASFLVLAFSTGFAAEAPKKAEVTPTVITAPTKSVTPAKKIVKKAKKTTKKAVKKVEVKK